MCGIVGLLLKKPALREQLGELMVPMLIGMTERGPDSAGLAVFTDAGRRRAPQVQPVLRPTAMRRLDGLRTGGRCAESATDAARRRATRQSCRADDVGGRRRR